MSSLHLRRRRRVADTTYYDHAPHSQGWRAANDDGLDAARGIFNALVYSLALWGVGGALWLVLAVMMGWA